MYSLDVDEVALLNLEAVWHEVVLVAGEGLHDVAALAAHVEVVDDGVRGDLGRARFEGEHVAPGKIEKEILK